METTKQKLKFIGLLFVVSLFLSFIFSDNYSYYRQTAAAANYDKMVGPRSLNPIKDILEVSRAYGALFGVDGCSLAKSMTGVFYVETNGKQNILNRSTKDPYKYIGSFQQGVPFVKESLKFVGSDLVKMYQLAKQGKLDKTTVEYISAAIRQGRALGPNRGRLHHMYATIIALAQHARMEKALQRITQNQAERGAAHVIFQFAPPKVGYAIRSGKLNLTFDAKGNCGLGRTTIAGAIKYIASGRSKCSSRMFKGMNLQNCSTPAGYDGPSGIGSLAEIPSIPTPQYAPTDPRDYLPPVGIPATDPFAGYSDIMQNTYQLPNSGSGQNQSKDNQNKSMLDRFDEMMMQMLFGQNMQGTLNPELINQNASLATSTGSDSSQDIAAGNTSTQPMESNLYVDAPVNVFDDFDQDMQEQYEQEDYLQQDNNEDYFDELSFDDEELDFSSDQNNEYHTGNGQYDLADSSGQQNNPQTYLRPKRPTRTQSHTKSQNMDLQTQVQGSNDVDNQYDTQDLIPLQEIYDEKQKAPDFLTDTGSFEQNVFDTDSPGRLAYYFDQDKDLTVKTEDIEAFMRYMSELEKKDPEAFYRQNIKEEQQIMQTQQKQKPSFWQWLWYIFSFKWLFN